MGPPRIALHVTPYVISFKFFRFCVGYYVGEPHLFVMWIHHTRGDLKEFSGWARFFRDY